jgi:GTPase SAR1 family protein
MNKDFILLNGKSGSREEVQLRKEHVKNIVIEHPVYETLWNMIDDCHKFSIGSSKADGIFIFGETGVGKSTILEKYVENYPKEVLETYTKIPIVKVRIPVGAKPKSVASQILWSMGDPNFDRGTEINMTARIYSLVEKCEVEMIILDEFQHLIDSETQHILNKASDWVKTFFEEVNIPMILCGMPSSQKIFQRNEQLDRRFCNRYEVKGFKYGSREEQYNFRGFLNSIDRQLPYPKQSFIADTLTAEKLYYVSLGVPFYIMKLLEEATVYAVKHGIDFITEECLYVAYQSMRRSTRPRAINPFGLNDFNLIKALEDENKVR